MQSWSGARDRRVGVTKTLRKNPHALLPGLRLFLTYLRERGRGPLPDVAGQDCSDGECVKEQDVCQVACLESFGDWLFDQVKVSQDPDESDTPVYAPATAENYVGVVYNKLKARIPSRTRTRAHPHTHTHGSTHTHTHTLTHTCTEHPHTYTHTYKELYGEKCFDKHDADGVGKLMRKACNNGRSTSVGPDPWMTVVRANVGKIFKERLTELGLPHTSLHTSIIRVLRPHTYTTPRKTHQGEDQGRLHRRSPGHGEMAPGGTQITLSFWF
jgi:hypothetical protein